MTSADYLKRILEVTEENNRMLKDLIEHGIAIQLPNIEKYSKNNDNLMLDSNETLNKSMAMAIKETPKPKISKSATDIIEINSDITAWIDSVTGLMWEVKNDKSKNLIMSFKECSAYVDNLNIVEYSGFNDWRLPTLKELKTILTTEANNGLWFVKKPLSKNTNYGYWTATKYDENFSMIVNFRNGKEIKSEKNNMDYVRCVRGGTVE